MRTLMQNITAALLVAISITAKAQTNVSGGRPSGVGRQKFIKR
jgi:hypothetical protein